jgi:hypothetical protein
MIYIEFSYIKNISIYPYIFHYLISQKTFSKTYKLNYFPLNLNKQRSIMKHFYIAENNKKNQ